MLAQSTATSARVPLFLIGVGFIGGSLLHDLRASGKYEITVLVRGEDKAAILRSMGVTPLVGTLDDDEMLVRATLDNDIIIHTATADHAGSVASVLKGLAQRPESRPAPVFIHTSGARVLIGDASQADGNHASNIIFSDLTGAQIDALPDTAYHRDVDLLIKNAVLGGKVGKARVTMVIPPLIYGIGMGPFNRLSIQVPGWIREAIAAKQVTVIGNGSAMWNNIHISNLVTAYTALLDQLLSSPPSLPSANVYCFAETGEHTWRDLGEAIHVALQAKGLVDKEMKEGGPPGNLGSNARNSADRLRAAGWKGDETNLSLFASVSSELAEMLKGQ